MPGAAARPRNAPHDPGTEVAGCSVLPPLSRQIATRWDRIVLLGDPPDYEPPAGEKHRRRWRSFAWRRPGRVLGLRLPWSVGDGGRIYFPVTNTHGDLEVVRELIEDPHTLARFVGWRRTG